MGLSSKRPGVKSQVPLNQKPQVQLQASLSQIPSRPRLQFQAPPSGRASQAAVTECHLLAAQLLFRQAPILQAREVAATHRLLPNFRLHPLRIRLGQLLVDLFPLSLLPAVATPLCLLAAQHQDPRHQVLMYRLLLRLCRRPREKPPRPPALQAVCPVQAQAPCPQVSWERPVLRPIRVLRPLVQPLVAYTLCPNRVLWPQQLKDLPVPRYRVWCYQTPCSPPRHQAIRRQALCC